MKINNIIKYLKHILFIGFMISNIIINMYDINNLIFTIYTILTLIYSILYVLEFIKKSNDLLLNNLVSIFFYFYIFYFANYISNTNNHSQYLKLNLIIISVGLLLLIANQILNILEKKNN